MKPETKNPNLITIIPVKPFAEAKTRLASILSRDERAALSRHLLRRTIRVAQTVGAVAVVSRSAAARHTAKKAGAWALVETESDLNAAIRQGIAWAVSRGATAVLALPLDLPTVTPDDLRTFIALANTPTAIAIAPCRHGLGTNALLLRPPTLIAPHFGENSFARHRTAAEAIEFVPHICRLPGLSFDLDTAADWEDIHQLIPNLSDNLTNLGKFDVRPDLK